MFELTINGQVYQFNFGMSFLRDANKTVSERIKNTQKVISWCRVMICENSKKIPYF